MSQPHYSRESSDYSQSLTRPVQPSRLRTEGSIEDYEAVPPPPRLMQREIPEFKGPKFAVHRENE